MNAQTMLHESFQGPLLEDAQYVVAQAIFFIRSSLSIVEKESWRHTWKKIGEFGLGFSPPSYHNMRHYLLDKCYNEVKERFNCVTLSNLKLSRCTIVSDG